MRRVMGNASRAGKKKRVKVKGNSIRVIVGYNEKKECWNNNNENNNN